MNIKEMTSALEAVLFACGEPMPIDRICSVFVVDMETANEALKALEKSLDERNSGLKLVKLGVNYQICTRHEHAEYIKSALDLRRRTPLSAAAFEVLSVIAYNQPITKAFVEQVRGVDCSGVITTLVDKELIEEKGRLELPGRPLLYGTTDNFLRCFSLSSLSELPPLPKDEQTDENSAEQISLKDYNVPEESEQGGENSLQENSAPEVGSEET